MDEDGLRQETSQRARAVGAGMGKRRQITSELRGRKAPAGHR